MARKTTPTFIVEVPLSVTRADAREMGVRLELGRQLYNACARAVGCRIERAGDAHDAVVAATQEKVEHPPIMTTVLSGAIGARARACLACG